MSRRFARKLGGCVWAALLVALPAVAQLTNFSRIHSFGHPELSGHYPEAPVIEDRDGWLYGTTQDGGLAWQGVVFRVAKDGGGYRVLHHFGLERPDGERPRGRLLLGSDGVLYGTTSWGGADGAGTVFRLGKDGSGYSILHNFAGWDGSYLDSGIIEGSDGVLYGTTEWGGTNNQGTIFKLNKDGGEFQVIRSMVRASGSNPQVLFEGAEGNFYGVCTEGGAQNRGLVYTLRRNGEGYAVLHDFTVLSQGTHPFSLMEGRDNQLYGTTTSGGNFDGGIVFRLGKDGREFQLLRSLGGPGDGRIATGLAEGEAGVLYGTTMQGGLRGDGTAFRLNADGTGYAVLHHFAGTEEDGAFPQSSLCWASDGLLYGVTSVGGLDYGTLYQLSTGGGAPHILWKFVYVDGGDGVYPSGLTEGRDGFLYATTYAGGRANSGTLVRSSRDGASYSVLRSFWSIQDGEDDSDWYGGPLLEGSDGWIYGTTSGGEHGEELRLYRIGRDGRNYSVVHLFGQSDFTSGEGTDGIMEASDGFLYGTSTGVRSLGGQLFRVNQQTGQFHQLRQFGLAGNDHIWPNSVPVESRDGRLYGSAYGEAGSLLYCVNKDGSGYHEVRRFDPGTEGWAARSLLEGNDGLLYGVTWENNTNSGVIFRIARDGSDFVVLRESVPASEPGPVLLLEGLDNGLYGSCWSWAAFRSFLFRLNKDGSGFRILTEEGCRSMVRGRDGAFYGVNYSGREGDLGRILRYGQALELRTTAAGQRTLMTLTCTGIPGYNYELQRSTNLFEWTTLQAFVMPESLRVEFEDIVSGNAAFYRLRVP